MREGPLAARTRRELSSARDAGRPLVLDTARAAGLVLEAGSAAEAAALLGRLAAEAGHPIVLRIVVAGVTPAGAPDLAGVVAYCPPDWSAEKVRGYLGGLASAAADPGPGWRAVPTWYGDAAVGFGLPEVPPVESGGEEGGR